ncbi:uncharacterized protein LOC126895006 isoform X1 [Daktulosphaira vitifoliae]|uniref:uncharacterized protein LOC126895006 isoform X1 n=1 Tax=Daktulosphaira vitifoliae TaxID=58002 RepID=UPI0021AA670F|nr:uncharacterized protein LOC126895006 isoform X1 [Daktulosphaira vitifoliae]
MQVLLVNFEEHVNKNGKISAFKANEILNNLNGTNIERNAEDFNLGDDEMIDISEKLMFIFNSLILFEEAFYKLLRNGDEKNNGFVSREYAKDVILKCELFGGRLKGFPLNKLLEKYTNEQDQFNYLEMKKNSLDDVEVDKSNVYSYNYEKKKWVRKYKFTPTHCL